MLRTAYVLHWRSFSLVPVDLALPIADVTAYEPIDASAARDAILGPIHGALRASGIGDLVIIPSMGYVIEESRHHLDRTFVGLSLYFSVPTGQYDATHPVNLGSNRYGFQQELSVGPFCRVVKLGRGCFWLVAAES